MCCKRPNPVRPRRRGFVWLELIVVISFAVVLAALLMTVSVQYAKARRQVDTQRTLRLAAEAEWVRIVAGVAAWPEGTAPPRALEPGESVICASVSPVAGEPALTQLTVVARKRISPQRLVRVEVSGYCRRPGELP